MNKKVKCLIYCTKANPNLYKPFEYDCFEQDEASRFYLSKIPMLKEETLLNGKIVAQFDCEKVEKFDVPYPAYFWEVKDELEHITKGSCLSLMSLHHYLKNDSGYAIHISNLEIFDEPKELNDFKLFNPNYYLYTNIKRAPQNMCYVVKEPPMCFAPSEEYILISIRPEWVCKILNGEKTIEVRKQVLNTLKELI